jgi:hypothetical protein
MIPVDGTTPRGAKPCRLVKILDANRQPMQQRQIVRAHDRILSLFGCGSSPSHIKSDEGVDGRVHLLDAGKTALQQLHGREGPAADQAARFTSREVARFSQDSSLS